MYGKEMIPPDAAARIATKIAAYNEDRVAVEAEYRRLLLIVYGATALAAAICAFVAWQLPARQSETQATIYAIAFAIPVMVLFQGRELAKSPKKQFQQAARDRLFPQIFSIVEDFRYQRGGNPASLSRMPASLTGKYKRAMIDDMMAGSWSGFRFEIYEAKLYTPQENTDVIDFRGVVAAFPLEHPFPGTLLAVKDKGATSRFLRDLFTGDGLVSVRSGNVGLDGIYEFRSTRPEAATAMLKGPLAEALKWLRSRWPREPARLALIGSDGFLLLPGARNLFELPGIATELDYTQHVEPIVRDLLSLVTTASLVNKATAPPAS